MTPEVALRRQICAYLQSKGAFIFVHDSVGIYDARRKCYRKNFDPFRIKGVSDILGIWQNRFIAVEVKIKGRYATKEQKEFLAQVKANGGLGILAYSLDDVRSALYAMA